MEKKALLSSEHWLRAFDQDTRRKKCPKCNCIQAGHACKSQECDYPGPPKCVHRLNNLDTEAIFGPGEVTLHPCFTNWIAKNEAMEPAWLTTQYLFDIIYDETRPVPFQDSGKCADWHAKWTELDSNKENVDSDVLALQRQLVRLAFTCAPSNGIFYSFCLENEDFDGSEEDWDGPWRSTATTEHCRSCGKCAVHYVCQSQGNDEF